jgi:peptide chain release factor subunit 3
LDPKDRKVFYAFAGENVKIKVKGIEENDIKRGHMLCSCDNLCPVV